MDEARTGAVDVDLDERLFKAYFGDRMGERTPRFSTDLQIAWILMGRLLQEHEGVELSGLRRGRWICRIPDCRSRDDDRTEDVVAEAATAPLAIARAALRAIRTPQGHGACHEVSASA